MKFYQMVIRNRWVVLFSLFGAVFLILKFTTDPRVHDIDNEFTEDFNSSRTFTRPVVHHLMPDENQCPDIFKLSSTISLGLYKFLKVKQISNYAESKTKVQDLGKLNKQIVIMTPVSNNAKEILPYFQLLCSLSYPHELITIVIGEDSSKDKTYQEVMMYKKLLGDHFSSIHVFHFNKEMPNKYKFDKHKKSFQAIRRSHLAAVRNFILEQGLKEHSFVLWIDADVKYVPHDIIQHLMYEDKDIIVPSCMYYKERSNTFGIYDLNTWQETLQSLQYLELLNPDELQVEGYDQSLRLYLPDIKDSGLLVKLDGVGGCVLMVKADCFRKGLKFPETIYENHIETEGMAKMARRMKFEVYGLPFVKVLHS